MVGAQELRYALAIAVAVFPNGRGHPSFGCHKHGAANILANNYWTRYFGAKYFCALS
jgi:hypothetical protein